MGTVKNIQALRGVAALLVVFSHFKYVATPIGHALTISPRLVGGAAGVDIFFIISGYVIAMTAVKREHLPGGFFLARVARVWPLYLVLTLLRLGWHQESFQSIWNGLFFLPIFDWKTYSGPPLSVGWTLSFEMWFYTIFAVLMVFFKPRRVAIFLPAFFCFGAAVMTFYRGDWYFPHFMFHPFVIEFAFGCVVFTVQRFISHAVGWTLLVLGAILLLFFAFHFYSIGECTDVMVRKDLAWLRILIWGSPAALLVAGAVGIERNGGWIFPSWLIGAGTISYSLYLVHTTIPGAVARILLFLSLQKSTCGLHGYADRGYFPRLRLLALGGTAADVARPGLGGEAIPCSDSRGHSGENRGAGGRGLELLLKQPARAPEAPRADRARHRQFPASPYSGTFNMSNRLAQPFPCSPKSPFTNGSFSN